MVVKTKYSTLLLLISLITSCIEKDNFYTKGEIQRIELLCNITWAGEKQANEDGISWQSIWEFNSNGTYKRTNIETDKEGNTKESTSNGLWSFYDPTFNIIYLGHKHYWDIQILTEEEFSFYDRDGEYGDPSMTRNHITLTPYNPSKY